MKKEVSNERATSISKVYASIPQRIEAITSGRKKVVDLETRDISASGTFITTLTSFPEGTRCKVHGDNL